MRLRTCVPVSVLAVLSARHRLGTLCAVMVVTLFSPRVSRGQVYQQGRLSHDSPTRLASGQPLLFSISGGISLGAYQAGVNWGLLEIYRRANGNAAFADTFKIPSTFIGAITGASAGNINTLLWAIEACTVRKPLPPSESLFWQLWTAVGVAQLMPDPKNTQADRSLFDRQFFRDSMFPLIRAGLVRRELNRSCLIRAGLTITRIRPDTLDLLGLPVSTQRYATAFRIGSSALSSGDPKLQFWPPDPELARNPRFGKLVVPPRGSDRVHIGVDTVLQMVLASSAFPLAFQPLLLKLEHDGVPIDSTLYYLDGGLFDNNPVSLAIELYRNGPGAVLSNNGRRDTVSLVYVNPGRLRGQLAKAQEKTAAAPAPGGLGSVLQTLSGAIPTARQYELQLVARDTDLLQPEELLFRLTSRAHPVVGHHLHAFAAFLAKPFREYDFYVGVYDALHFTANQYACGREDDQPCIRRNVRRLILDPPFDTGPDAPRLLAALYNREFGTDSIKAAEFPATTTPADSTRLALLLGIMRAMEPLYSPARKRCPPGSLPATILCADRFGEVLRALHDDPFVGDFAETQRKLCEKKDPGKAENQEPCAEEKIFERLVDAPEKETALLLDRLLGRLQTIEHQLHMYHDSAYGDLPKAERPKRTDQELVAELLISLYRARPLRPRYGFEWTASSAPQSAWFAQYFLPYQVGVNLNSDGVEAGIRPTYHASDKLALIAPAMLYTAAVPAGTGGTERHVYAGGGAGLALKGMAPRPLSILIPEFGVTGQRLVPLSERGSALWLGEAYVDLGMLTGRLHLAYRRISEPNELFDGKKHGFTIGIADLNGMLYWLAKFRN